MMQLDPSAGKYLQKCPDEPSSKDPIFSSLEKGSWLRLVT